MTVPVPESIRATAIETLQIAIGGVLFNVSNFPEKAQTRLLGQSMRPLNDRLTTAIVEQWLPAVVAQVQADALEEAAQIAEGIGSGLDQKALGYEDAAWIDGAEAAAVAIREGGKSND